MATMQANPIDWLLAEDRENPGVRYFALIDLLEAPADSKQVQLARASLMESGPVPLILASQAPEGWWAKAGPGYSPKYRGTVWQILLLAELGADPAEARVQLGIEYLLGHAISTNGGFSAYQDARPSGVLHCLNGNLLWALIQLGRLADSRVQTALEWQARAIVGVESVKYLASGTSGPDFSCGINGGLSCAWGANKAMRAMLAVPPDARSAEMDRSIARGVDLLLSRDPAVADYPNASKTSQAWFKFGFPLSYWSDVLETVKLLGDAGQAGRPELSRAIELILERQDELGRWKLQNSLNGKMWCDIEARGKPSKWVTLRALRALKSVEVYAPAG